MEARPRIQVDLKVDGEFLCSVVLGSESMHPFTKERLKHSQYPAGDAALMLHYAALMVAQYDVPSVFQDVLQLLYDEDARFFSKQDDLPF
jgi:hypothetical protein